jgi:hypothetical protein
MRILSCTLPLVLAFGILPGLRAEDVPAPAGAATAAAADGAVDHAAAARLLAPFQGRWTVVSGKMTTPTGETHDMPPETKLVFAFAGDQLTVVNPGGSEEVSTLNKVAADGAFVTCEMQPGKGGEDIVLKIRLQTTATGMKLEAEESRSGGKIVVEFTREAAEGAETGPATAAGPATPAAP